MLPYHPITGKSPAPLAPRCHPGQPGTSLTAKLGNTRYRHKDNNVAERAIRGPVVTRKNARGSHNGDTARNAAVIWTVTATARMAGLNVLTYLTAYFDACGRNGGKPLAGRALERFLPWNASPEDLRTWAQPPPAGPNPPQ